MDEKFKSVEPKRLLLRSKFRFSLSIRLRCASGFTLLRRDKPPR